MARYIYIYTYTYTYTLMTIHMCIYIYIYIIIYGWLFMIQPALFHHHLCRTTGRQVTLTVELPVAADVASSAAANSCEDSNPFLVNMGMVYYWA